ncbi:hypothetical protein BS78_K137600 [Paspalum vaginatum]|uniref:Uncharacterized protein n=1 Tax=Paspalum vaginatum TaxID=158149 RepID=A0A9W7XC54_9POAL|nr:hypothetical protein BS78_K137600 [Paspalum vaginatum]
MASALWLGCSSMGPGTTTSSHLFFAASPAIGARRLQCRCKVGPAPRSWCTWGCDDLGHERARVTTCGLVAMWEGSSAALACIGKDE